MRLCASIGVRAKDKPNLGIRQRVPRLPEQGQQGAATRFGARVQQRVVLEGVIPLRTDVTLDRLMAILSAIAQAIAQRKLAMRRPTRVPRHDPCEVRHANATTSAKAPARPATASHVIAVRRWRRATAPMPSTSPPATLTPRMASGPKAAIRNAATG